MDASPKKTFWPTSKKARLLHRPRLLRLQPQRPSQPHRRPHQPLRRFPANSFRSPVCAPSSRSAWSIRSASARTSTPSSRSTSRASSSSAKRRRASTSSATASSSPTCPSSRAPSSPRCARCPSSTPPWKANAIRYHQNINLGIAVSLDWGLIVPVIKQAEEKNFLGIARAIVDLAERARGKKLKPDEVASGTFTITNPGIFGEQFGTPIINQPESAILGVGGLFKEPAVVTAEDGTDSVAIRYFLHLTLGFDHRIIDGADAGKFMAEVKKYLERLERGNRLRAAEQAVSESPVSEEAVS